ncbi:hypothetical protein EOS_03305 [Caballeronia mineralivorans PML1(12)]|uniref:Uncharacterized protein n=1 Tax=Caballeronia mineralivorans PML1(12) TaxID=908627 RepID=A0A0J1D4M2_9BURK|nr:hypothetical protein EOS_03305 [Caballeronia mineralivorans PML1(12)]
MARPDERPADYIDIVSVALNGDAPGLGKRKRAQNKSTKPSCFAILTQRPRACCNYTSRTLRRSPPL